MWSEDWTQSVWVADPLLEVAGGMADPTGGTAAMQLTNTAGTSQQIIQNTSGPSGFRYCHSVYVRSDVTAVIQLVVAATGATVSYSGKHKRFVDACDGFGQSHCSTGWDRIRRPIARRCSSGRIWRSSGGTAGGGAVQENDGSRRYLFEYPVFVRLVRGLCHRAEPECLSSRLGQQLELTLARMESVSTNDDDSRS